MPPDLESLLDPDTPLERPERFVPGGLIGVGEPFAALLVGGAFGLGLFGAALYSWARVLEGAEADPAGQYVAPILAAIAWSKAAAAWLTLRRARAQRDRLDRGRWREGLFVEDDGLLLVIGDAEPRWIAREDIDGVDEGWPARLRLRGGEAIPLPGDGGALARRLNPWRAGKPFAWEERL